MLLFRRDDKPSIPYPGQIDILGGHVEEWETSDEAITREMSEELLDRVTGREYALVGHSLFMVHVDSSGMRHHIYCKEADFEIEDVTLTEGQELQWLTEEEILHTPLAFGFGEVVKDFFASDIMKAMWITAAIIPRLFSPSASPTSISLLPSLHSFLARLAQW